MKTLLLVLCLLIPQQLVGLPDGELLRPRPTPWIAPINFDPQPSIVSYPTQMATLSPAGYWRLSETTSTFADSAGSHALTVSGSLTRGATTTLNDDSNAACTFNSGSAASTTFLTSTTSEWVTWRQRFVSTVDGNVVEVGPQASTGWLRVRWQQSSSNWRISVIATDGTTDQVEIGGFFNDTPITGRNYSVFVTVENSPKTAKLYLDGRLTGTAVFTKTPKEWTAAKSITVGESGFNSTIDEVAVGVDAVPTASAVNDLFKSGLGIDLALTSFYAAYNGTYNAHATLADPIELQAGLSNGLVQAGTTLWLRGLNRTVTDAVTNGTTTVTSATASFSAGVDQGAPFILSGGGNLATFIESVTNSTTVVLVKAPSWSSSGNTAIITPPYRGNYTFAGQGAAGNLATIRNYNGERAIIDGGGTSGILNALALTSAAAYVQIWGLEAEYSGGTRLSAQSGSTPTDLGRPVGQCIGMAGDHNKAINNIVHDCGNGISNNSGGTNYEAYGNLILNNGWQGTDRPHGHGTYDQNAAPSTALLKDNISGYNFDYGFHAFGTATAIDDIVYEGNVGLMAAAPSMAYGGAGSGAASNWIVSADVNFTGVTITDNHSYLPCAQASSMYFPGRGPSDTSTSTLTMAGNTSVGGLTLGNWLTANISGQKTYSCGPGSGGIFATGSRNTADPTSVNWTVNSNTYYNLTVLSGGLRKGYDVNVTGLQSFAQYKTLTGFDGSSTQTEAVMPDVVYVRPNSYETGRCHVIAYTASGATSVSVNLSTCGLSTGQSFTIQTALNYFGQPIYSGTYNGSNVTMPVSDTSLQIPNNFSTYSGSMVSPSPLFFVGIVVPGAQSAVVGAQIRGTLKGWVIIR